MAERRGENGKWRKREEWKGKWQKDRSGGGSGEEGFAGGGDESSREISSIRLMIGWAIEAIEREGIRRPTRISRPK
jgi:hypothetical protein